METPPRPGLPVDPVWLGLPLVLFGAEWPPDEDIGGRSDDDTAPLPILLFWTGEVSF